MRSRLMFILFKDSLTADPHKLKSDFQQTAFKPADDILQGKQTATRSGAARDDPNTTDVEKETL